MKTKLFFLISILFFWNVNAQNIQFADPNLKKLLLSADSSNTHVASTDEPDENGNVTTYSRIDTNFDNEIQVSEAQAIKYLHLYNWYLFNIGTITNLSGLEYFINLETLDFTLSPVSVNSFDASIYTKLKFLLQPNVADLNLQNITTLKILDISFSYNLKNIDLSTNSALIKLKCTGSGLESLDVSKNVLLKQLDCGRTKIATLDLSNNLELTNLSCYENYNMTSLDLSKNINLVNVVCNKGNLNNLKLDGLSNLENLDCSENELTALGLSSNSKLKYLKCYNNLINGLDCANNPDLLELNCGNNQISNLNISNSTQLKDLRCYSNLISSLNVSKNINLSYLNCSSNSMVELDLSNNLLLSLLNCNSSSLISVNLKNTQKIKSVNSSPFIFGSNLKYLCCDSENVQYYLDLVKLNNIAPEINSYCSFEPGGNYNIVQGKLTSDANVNGCDENDIRLKFIKLKIEKVDNISYSLSDSNGEYEIFVKTGDYVITPVFESSYFNGESINVSFSNDNNNIFVHNFCYGISPKNDLDIQIVPLSQARPGFNVEYQLIYKNKGTTTLSGNVLFAFNDDKINYISSDTTPNSVETGKLTFNFTDLKPFEEKTIKLILKINPPTDANFPVNGGDILSYSAQVFPIADDETPRDNTFALRQEVVNSVDPNDKTCLEGDIITPDLVGNDVHYLIRFENVGTANAVNVVVKDMIDTTKFDVESLQPIKSSHPYRMTITEGNKVEFFFENIQLPFDDANNDGYILFKIKTKPTLVVGNTFSNKADIYFDYNFPIATNEAITTVQSNLSTQEFSKSEISIYPNPVKDILTFKTKEKVKKAEIYDTNGRLVKVELGISNNQMNVSSLKTGTYVIKVISDKKSYQTKMIKQ